MVIVSESVILALREWFFRKADALRTAQLVGLYAKKPGISLGVFIRNKGYVFGESIVRTHLEYRDELVQRVNNNGLLIGGAQRHA